MRETCALLRALVTDSSASVVINNVGVKYGVVGMKASLMPNIGVAIGYGVTLMILDFMAFIFSIICRNKMQETVVLFEVDFSKNTPSHVSSSVPIPCLEISLTKRLIENISNPAGDAICAEKVSLFSICGSKDGIYIKFFQRKHENWFPLITMTLLKERMLSYRVSLLNMS